MFEIDSTPFPSRRLVTGKYTETFAALRPGQCIKTEPDRVSTVATAMKTWIKRTGKKDVIVRTVGKMPDGFGRVYLMPAKPVKMADLPGHKVVSM